MLLDEGGLWSSVCSKNQNTHTHTHEPNWFSVFRWSWMIIHWLVICSSFISLLITKVYLGWGPGISNWSLMWSITTNWMILLLFTCWGHMTTGQLTVTLPIIGFFHLSTSLNLLFNIFVFFFFCYISKTNQIVQINELWRIYDRNIPSSGIPDWPQISLSLHQNGVKFNCK